MSHASAPGSARRRLDAQIVSEAREQRLRQPSMGSRVAQVARQIEAAIEHGSGPPREDLELVWRRAYRRVRAELATTRTRS